MVASLISQIYYVNPAWAGVVNHALKLTPSITRGRRWTSYCNRILTYAKVYEWYCNLVGVRVERRVRSCVFNAEPLRSCIIVKHLRSQFRSVHTSALIPCFIFYGHIFFPETDSVTLTIHRPINLRFLREWDQAPAITCTVKREVVRSSFTRSADWACKDTFGFDA